MIGRKKIHYHIYTDLGVVAHACNHSRRLRQKDYKFKANLDYTGDSCPK
jgi:hypothetical protein